MSNKYKGVGDKIILKDNIITNKFTLLAGTILEITFIDRQSFSYCCDCLDKSISVWLYRNQFDFLNMENNNE